MGKTKRIVVEAAGALREIYKIEERSSGDLTIIAKVGRAIGFEMYGKTASENEKKVCGQHFSAHRSLNSSGYTFKYTVQYEDGEVYDVSAFCIPDKHKVAWPIIFSWLPTLDDDRYISRSKYKERVELIPYNPLKTSLLVGIIITESGVGSLKIGDNFCGEIIVNFKHFDVHIWYIYTPTVSLVQGDSVNFGTAAPRISGKPINDALLRDVSMQTRERWDEISTHVIGYLARRYAQRMIFMAEGVVADIEHPDIPKIKSFVTSQMRSVPTQVIWPKR